MRNVGYQKDKNEKISLIYLCGASFLLAFVLVNVIQEDPGIELLQPFDNKDAEFIQFYRERFENIDDISENKFESYERLNEIEADYAQFRSGFSVFADQKHDNDSVKWYAIPAKAQDGTKNGDYNSALFDMTVGFKKLKTSGIPVPFVYDPKYMSSIEIRDVVLGSEPEQNLTTVNQACLYFEAETVNGHWFKFKISGQNECSLVWRLLQIWCYSSRSFSEEKFTEVLELQHTHEHDPKGVRFSFTDPPTIAYYDEFPEFIYIEKMTVETSMKKEYGHGHYVNIYAKLFDQEEYHLAIYNSPFENHWKRLTEYYNDLTKVYGLQKLIPVEGHEEMTTLEILKTPLKSEVFLHDSNFVFEPQTQTCSIVFGGDDKQKLKLNYDNTGVYVNTDEDYETTRLVVNLIHTPRISGNFELNRDAFFLFYAESWPKHIKNHLYSCGIFKKKSQKITQPEGNEESYDSDFEENIEVDSKEL